MSAESEVWLWCAIVTGKSITTVPPQLHKVRAAARKEYFIKVIFEQAIHFIVSLRD
jgi:hypothetical protein